MRALGGLGGLAVSLRAELVHARPPEQPGEVQRGQGVHFAVGRHREQAADAGALDALEHELRVDAERVRLQPRRPGGRYVGLAGVHQDDLLAAVLEDVGDAAGDLAGAGDEEPAALALGQPEPPREPRRRQPVECDGRDDDREGDGTRRSACSNPASRSRSAKTEETAAATTPRGAIQERNARSRQVRVDRRLDASTAAGRATNMTTATNAAARQPSPANCATSSRDASNTKRADTSRTVRLSLNSRMCLNGTNRWLARATPITVTASSPASCWSRLAPVKAATTIMS